MCYISYNRRNIKEMQTRSTPHFINNLKKNKNFLRAHLHLYGVSFLAKNVNEKCSLNLMFHSHQLSTPF